MDRDLAFSRGHQGHDDDDEDDNDVEENNKDNDNDVEENNKDDDNDVEDNDNNKDDNARAVRFFFPKQCPLHLKNCFGKICYPPPKQRFYLRKI